MYHIIISYPKISGTNNGFRNTFSWFGDLANLSSLHHRHRPSAKIGSDDETGGVGQHPTKPVVDAANAATGIIFLIPANQAVREILFIDLHRFHRAREFADEGPIVDAWLGCSRQPWIVSS